MRCGRPIGEAQALRKEINVAERYLEARKAYHLETSLAAACARPGTGLPVVDV